MDNLSKAEIEKAIDKIRKEYERLSKEDSQIFNVYPFEKRYTQILVQRANVQRFIRDEIIFLDQLKNKYNAKKKKMEAAKGETIDKILAEQEAKIQKYKKIDFHPLVKAEIKYFYGAIVAFTSHEIQFLYRIFRGTPEMNQIQEPVYIIEKVGLTRSGKLSPKMSEHMNMVQDAKGSNSIVERESQLLLRETCKALYDTCAMLEDFLRTKRVKPEQIIRFQEGDAKGLVDKYQGHTNQMVIDEIIQKAHQIIFDFRMDSLIGLKRKESRAVSPS
ncbi:MAG: hypothetical protein AAF518_28695 [Spirochaetota bacterium]